MRTGGGPYIAPEPNEICEVYMDNIVDLELRCAYDSDSVIPQVSQSSGSQPNSGQLSSNIRSASQPITSQPSTSRQPTVYAQPITVPNIEEVASVPNFLNHEDHNSTDHTYSVGLHEATNRSGSQQSDHGIAVAPTSASGKNVRARVIAEEFTLRQENYQIARSREELHILKIKEREYLVRAAEELFLKTQIERQTAEALLKSAQTQREEAELKL